LVARSRKIRAEAVKKMRLHKKWSQRDLAERIGRTPSYVSQIESCERGISDDDFDLIADVSGLSFAAYYMDELPNVEPDKERKLTPREAAEILSNSNVYLDIRIRTNHKKPKIS
jgi:transcriptional regulator with XRE-family HTH domain